MRMSFLTTRAGPRDPGHRESSRTARAPGLGKLCERDRSGVIAPGSPLIVDQVQQFAVVDASNVSDRRHSARVHLFVYDQSTVISEYDSAQIFLDLLCVFGDHQGIACQGREDTRDTLATSSMTRRTVLHVQRRTRWTCLNG